MAASIVVYTAVYGDKDELKDSSVSLPNCDLVCFTDNEALESKAFGFQPPIHPDPVRAAKIFKIMPHRFFPEYTYSLWVDASVILKRGDIRGLVKKCLETYDMAAFPHPLNDCVYCEAETCLAEDLDDEETIKMQMNQYRSLGYPSHGGLIASAFILRRHMSPPMVRLDEDWWTQIQRFSRRDLLSFNYVAWKNNFSYYVFPENVPMSKYIQIMEHSVDTVRWTTAAFPMLTPLERLHSKFLTLLLDIYLKRTDLRQEFPEVMRGDLRRLLPWAAIAARGEDSHSPTLARYAFLYALFATYSVRPDLQEAFPLALERPESLIRWAARHNNPDSADSMISEFRGELTLCDVYNSRRDLRKALPGVMFSDQRFPLLLEWAIDYGCSTDSASSRLRPYVERYRRFLSSWP